MKHLPRDGKTGWTADATLQPTGRGQNVWMYAWSSVRPWLPNLQTGFDPAPARLPAPDPVLHMSAPVRRGAVGLA